MGGRSSRSEFKRLRQFQRTSNSVGAQVYVSQGDDEIAYAPLQEFGEMLTRSTKNRIQSCDDRQLCECRRIALYLNPRACCKQLVMKAQMVIWCACLLPSCFRSVVLPVVVGTAQPLLQGQLRDKNTIISLAQR